MRDFEIDPDLPPWHPNKIRRIERRRNINKNWWIDGNRPGDLPINSRFYVRMEILIAFILSVITLIKVN